MTLTRGSTLYTAALVLAARVAGAALAFVLTIVIGRRLGADGSGVYFLAVTLALVAGILGRLGLDNAVIRYVSIAASQDDWDEVRRVYWAGILPALAASTAVSVTLVLLADVFADLVFDEPALASTLRLTGFAVVPAVLVFIHVAFLRGLSRPLAAELLGTSLVPVVMLALIFRLDDPAPADVAALFLIANVVVLAVVAGFVARRLITHDTRGEAAPSPVRRLLTTSMPLLLVASMELLLQWADILMLGALSDSRDVGLYTAAARSVLVMVLALVAFNAVLAPRFAALHASGSIDALRSLVLRFLRAIALVSLVPMLALMVAAGPILELFGADFSGGTTALRILAVAQFFHVIGGTLSQMLAVTGHEKNLRRSLVICAITNVVLNLVFIPIWGLNGAALATMLSFLLLVFINGRFARGVLVSSSQQVGDSRPGVPGT